MPIQVELRQRRHVNPESPGAEIHWQQAGIQTVDAFHDDWLTGSELVSGRDTGFSFYLEEGRAFLAPLFP